MASRFQFEQWVPFSLEQAFLFFARPANLPRIMPPKTGTRVESVRLVPPPARANPASPTPSPDPCPSATSVADLAGEGSETVTSFRVLPFLPFRATWVALITEFEWNHHFADVQKLGPFRSFHHRHGLTAEVRDGVSGTVVKDEVELELGYGWLGNLIERLFVSRQMQQTFQHRQNILCRLLAEDYLEGSTKTAVP